MKYLLMYQVDTADRAPGPCWDERKESLSADSDREAEEKARKILKDSAPVRSGAKLLKVIQTF